MKRFSTIVAAAAFAALCAGVARADTTTSRFGLTQPDIGSTNWGPKLNTNAGLIDNAAGLAKENTYTSSNTFNGSVALSKDVTATSTVTVSGPMTASSSCTLTGLTTVSGNLAVSSTMTVSGSSVSFNKGFTSNGSVSLNAPVVASSSVTFTGLTTIAGSTSGSLPASGNFGFGLSSACSVANALATGNFGDFASTTVPAGNFLIIAQATAKIFTGFQDMTVAISTTAGSGSSGSPYNLIVGVNTAQNTCPPATSNVCAATAIHEFSFNSSKTYYLKLSADYTSTVPTWSGSVQVIQLP